MTGVDFSAVCNVHGKTKVVTGTCLVGFENPKRIENAVRWYLFESRKAELIKLLEYEPF